MLFKFRTNKKAISLKEYVTEIKSSQNWTVPAGCTKIDAFLVGGGGGGQSLGSDYDSGNEEYFNFWEGGSGGGGGYTSAVYNIGAGSGELLAITVGRGGYGASTAYSEAYGDPGENGYSTNIRRSATVLANANGGYGGRYVQAAGGGNGGSGGGGGFGGELNSNGATGGQNGGNGGISSNHYTRPGGQGQGYSTVCPFNGIMYAGGGGGSAGKTGATGAGGAGGGGNGGRGGEWSEETVNGSPGAANTGGGGGGGRNGGNGGSGIVVLHYFAY